MGRARKRYGIENYDSGSDNHSKPVPALRQLG